MITRDENTPPVIPADRFLTPGGQIDFPGAPAKQDALNQLWNTNLSGFTAQGITGNPWTVTNSSDQTWYYDPTTTDQANAAYAPISWGPLPGRITYYFPDLTDTESLYSLADTGKDTDGKSFGQITTSPCDNSPDMQPYGPYGPRGWQDEYCEWSIERNAEGKIVRIDYTCENPEYWNSLWMIDPNQVLAIYRSALDKPQIELAELYLTDGSGNPVIDPSTGRPAYNPLNKWNNGPISTSTSGGAMHLTSTPNSLQTEIGLACAATTPRTSGNTDVGKLICCAQYGQVGRNSDPNIGAQVNRLVNSTDKISPAKVTLANPPGLYIQKPDFSSYETPDGKDASSFWVVKRGNMSLKDAAGRTLPGNFILHATFMVPPELGYTVSDIKINGTPIMYASQINQTFEMNIFGQAITQSGGGPATQSCSGSLSPSFPQPLQLFHKAVFDAMYATTYETVVGVNATLASNSTLIAPWVKPGDKNVQMTLVMSVADASKPPAVSFGEGVTVTTGPLEEVNYAIPGNSYPSPNYAMVISVTVDASAATGLRGCSLSYPGQAKTIPMPALLHIVAPGKS